MIKNVQEHFGEELSNKEKELINNGKKWALTYGLVRGFGDEFGEQTTYLPFSLYPSKLEASKLQKAYSIQEAYNEMYYNIAMDVNFLLSTLSSTRQTDPFIDSLCKIQENKLVFNRKQLITMAIFRNDMMVDSERQNQLTQVEFNVISIAFISQAQTINKLHLYQFPNLKTLQISESPIKAIALALKVNVTSNEYYKNQQHFSVLFVVLKNESNFADQIKFEQELKAQIPNFKCIGYVTLADIYENSTIENEKDLIYDGIKIHMVYFRAGYSPDHYSTEKEWIARTRIEQSVDCIKCPNVAMQLAGMKRVQAELVKPGVFSKFFPSRYSDIIRENVYSTFTDMFSLDNSCDIKTALEVVQTANYLMKPSTEGGSGENISSLTKIKNILNESKDTSKYILQKKIVPPAYENVLVVPGHIPQRVNAVSELGIFGLIIADKNGEIRANSKCGYLLRTKSKNVEKGGVSTGYSVLDSIETL
ncbi:hypothetical protein GJ496_008972 [Pomphorhynchus laevis]|nr:hypothetical protein GJ496_008972 [Pomphorhynchus laevis]